MVLGMGRARLRSDPGTYDFNANEHATALPASEQAADWDLRTDLRSISVEQRHSEISGTTSEPELRRGVLIALLISLTFLAVGLAISGYAGTNFTVPRSGDIPGLHINYWIPPIAAAIGYLLLQCAVGYLSSTRPSWQTIAKRAACDYLLLALFIFVIYIHFNIKMWIPVINPRL
jgi:hypothetical protein